MKIQYKKQRFNPISVKRIEQAESIINEYKAKGFRSLTLRQLYYQFVSRDLIPNNIKEYNKLKATISQARLCGLLDWYAIEDQTRSLMGINTSESPSDMLYDAAARFRLDFWAKQPIHVEVWIEKDALTGVISRVCNEYRVDHFACKGYTSQSEQWRAGQRFIDKIRDGQKVLILHLGDHDPSGIDMTRDNLERLKMFIQHETDAKAFNVKRLALNMDQVKKHKPPPNPAKFTDSRISAYVKKFGKTSWELDALDPETIHALIEKEIKAVIDKKAWDAVKRKEKEYRNRLDEVAASFEA